MSKTKCWYCLAPAALCVLDHALTIWGQPDWYWAYGYRGAVEAAPHGQWLLERHPIAFVAFGLAMVALYSTAILLLPRRGARIVALALVIGHSWGAATWLVSYLVYGYWLSLGFFLVVSIVLLWSWERAERITDIVRLNDQRSTDFTAPHALVACDSGGLRRE